MAIIDIDRMYFEMKSTMKNNFTGSPKNRYREAKKQFLKSVSETIDENKEGLLQEMEGLK